MSAPERNKKTDTPLPAVAEIGEKAIDAAFGLAVTAGEVAGKVGGYILSNAPAFVESLETKGRPLREKVTTSLRGGLHQSLQEDGQSAISVEDEIEALEKRVRELEAQVSGTTTDTPTATDASNDKSSGDGAA